jgi:maleylpyruvate isomerase
MKLYGYWRSSASWRVRLGLALKGLPYDQVPVHLVEGGGQQHSEAYRQRNPMRQVPTLELDDGASLQQSVAILEYLEETWPTPPLLPARPLDRARVRALVEVVNSGIQPLQNLSVLREVKALGGDPDRWASQAIERGLGALEALAAPRAGAFLFGDQPTLADCVLTPQLYGARRFGVDLSALPTLLRAEASLARLPGVAATHPDQQPDAPRPLPEP